MHKQMLINVADPEEARVAILEDDVLEELYVELASERRHAGDIYKATVLNIEQSIQAAFVELGLGKNGFLHASDIMPGLYGNVLPKTDPMKNRRRDEIPITKLVRRGQELLVQVSKESMGSKGPSVTTYLSIPGRYLVLMPGVVHLGVSRKIEDDETRQKLKTMLTDLDRPEGMGFIVRTAGAGRTKRDLARDMRHVMRIWQAIEKQARQASGPALLYAESDLVIRSVRDLFTSDTDELIVDSEEALKRAKEYLRIVSPASRRKVKLYTGATPLFHKYGIEDQIDGITERKVNLSNGGSIIVEQTEAMVVVDVNSGKFTEEKDPELTAFHTNMLAAPEVARQLRLRDKGGIVAIDFTDMKLEKHQRQVERKLADAMRRDRARSKMLRISRFGIIEMTRQRVRPGIAFAGHEVCPLCKGGGMVRSVEGMALYVMRQLRMRLNKPNVAAIEVVVNPSVAACILNNKRQQLVEIEKKYAKSINVTANGEFNVGSVDFQVEKPPRKKQTGRKETRKKTNVRNRNPRRASAQGA